MANKQIYELTTRTFNGDSLVPISIENTDPSTSAQYPQLAGKTSGNAISDFIANDQQYVTDLDTQNKTITGAINENKSVIGYSYDEYDATTAYAKDDLCIYNNVLYKALQATTGNLPTNTTYWEQTSIADEKQDVIDNSLQTTDKTVVGAINELNTNLWKRIPNYISFDITGTDLATTTIPANAIRDIFYNLDISSKLPANTIARQVVVETTDSKASICRQWLSGTNKISVSLGNPSASQLTITSVKVRIIYDSNI